MNPQPESPLPSLLAELEMALSLVQQALSARDAVLLEQQAAAVQRLMADALAQARQQPLDARLRQRLADCGAQMAAHRQALFRATAALDRAIDVLMPREPIGLYGESGRSVRARSSGDSLTA